MEDISVLFFKKKKTTVKRLFKKSFNINVSFYPTGFLTQFIFYCTYDALLLNLLAKIKCIVPMTPACAQALVLEHKGVSIMFCDHVIKNSIQHLFSNICSALSYMPFLSSEFLKGNLWWRWNEAEGPVTHTQMLFQIS